MRLFVAVDALRAGEVAIRGDEHHYAGRVRRARPGDAVELVDGAGRRAAGTIVRIAESETVVAAGEPERVVDPPPRIRVLIPWIKGDRMDTCVEKLVEVGCDEIAVFAAARAVVQLTGERLAARLGKLRALAAAAARQSRRATVPSVVTAELGDADAAATRLILDPSAPPAALPDLAARVVIASGPEGGLDASERAALVASGFAPLGLGPRILRAETAPLVAVAWLRSATAT